MSCVHDGGFGSSVSRAKCNAELAAVLDAPLCGALIGTMNGEEMRCNQRQGHFGGHSHTFPATLWTWPGWNGRIGMKQ